MVDLIVDVLLCRDDVRETVVTFGRLKSIAVAVYFMKAWATDGVETNWKKMTLWVLHELNVSQQSQLYTLGGRMGTYSYENGYRMRRNEDE